MEKYSKQNPRIKAIHQLHQKKYRDEKSLYFFEGNKLFNEAIAWKVPIEVIVCKEGWLNIERRKFLQSIEESSDNVSIYILSDKDYDYLSVQKQPEGILCVARKYEKTFPFMKRCVILEDIQDPQNAGAIIRSADAAGFDTIICSEDTADVFSEKSIRSSMGSVFHLGIIRGNVSTIIEQMKLENYIIIGSSLLGEETLEINFLEKTSKLAVVFGNESNGMKEGTQKACHYLYKIPIYGAAESLNVSVAAGIILYDIIKLIKYRP